MDLAMDSAGWVNARYLLEVLQRSPQERLQSTTMDDLAVIAAIGPKRRLQLGVACTREDGRCSAATHIFIRLL